jgi:hypothetical protein
MALSSRTKAIGKPPVLQRPLCQKRSYSRHGQKQPKRIGNQRYKAVAEIQSLAPRNLSRFTAVEYIQHDDRNAESLRGSGKARQTIDQQIAAIALSLNAAVDADHRNVGSWNVTVCRPCPREAARQCCVFDGVCVRCVEAQHIASGIDHDEGSQIVGLRKFVCRLAKEIVDLGDPARKRRPIMSVGIERLYQVDE